MHKFLLNIFCLLTTVLSFGQGHIVFSDNGIIRISGGAFVVVDNTAPQAITRVNTGHFITEGDLGTNRIRWMIGDNSAEYVVPFGVGTNEYIPVAFSTSGANGQGFFDLSTYASNTWKNSDFLPPAITNFNNINNTDNSDKVLDRFYRLEALNYIAKPALTDVQFSYRDIEHTVADNVIAEAGLQAQRWNSDLSTWSDYLPNGTADYDGNKVMVPTINPNDLFTWWVLVDKVSPLPLELLSFKAFLQSPAVVGLTWSTSQEINVDRFEIERSTDGIHFIKISQVKAVGNSQIQQNYATQDISLPPGATVLYYRLKMIDVDNSYKYSHTEVVKLNNNNGDWKLYPNPVSLESYIHLQVPAGIQLKEILCFDAKGRLISQHKQTVNNSNATYTVNIPVSQLPGGSYVIRAICNNGLVKNFTLVKVK